MSSKDIGSISVFSLIFSYHLFIALLLLLSIIFINPLVNIVYILDKVIQMIFQHINNYSFLNFHIIMYNYIPDCTYVYGNIILKVLPSFIVLSTSTFPPCFSIISLTIVKPSPFPPTVSAF